MSDPAAAPSAPRPIDAAAVRRTLERLAPSEQAPWLHQEVSRRMADRLQIVRTQPRQVLDWWSFAGAGHDTLTEAYPNSRRLIVEPTMRFRERSEAALRTPWWKPWTRVEAEIVAANEVAPGSVQLVWANMMLHASIDPAALFARWQRALAVDGFLMFSCLGPGSLRELRELYRAEGWGAPMAELVDMHDLGDMLVGAGFADPVMDQELLTLTWPSADALIDELRSWGGNAAPDRFHGLRTPRWRARLVQALEAGRDAQGRLVLTVEVVYGHAFKAPPRAPAKTETTVSLDAMRALVRSGSTRT